MRTLDLLLAVQVRQLAADLRSAARAAFYTSIFEHMPEDDRKRELAEWERAHPLAGFIPLALDEIEQVADRIHDLLEAPDQ
jgi:hypothetical protein